MYQKVGEKTTAAKYAELAKTVAPAASTPASTSPPRVGHRAETARKNSKPIGRTAQQPAKNAMR
jgi:hypothetical protein